MVISRSLICDSIRANSTSLRVCLNSNRRLSSSFSNCIIDLDRCSFSRISCLLASDSVDASRARALASFSILSRVDISSCFRVSISTSLCSNFPRISSADVNAFVFSSCSLLARPSIEINVDFTDSNSILRVRISSESLLLESTRERFSSRVFFKSCSLARISASSSLCFKSSIVTSLSFTSLSSLMINAFVSGELISFCRFSICCLAVASACDRSSRSSSSFLLVSERSEFSFRC
mmetsp:Transcript_14921/g.21543  ORF Transcript_14921/g.21543 Transcript_14921/m.21543 type:complete len:236 (-) Transcript_14921:696-1403(-)